MKDLKNAGIIERLQTDILRLEGHKPANSAVLDLGLGEIKNAFPNSTFPLGVVHEFLAGQAGNVAATMGFIAGLVAPMMEKSGTILWISCRRTLFPPALKSFGLQPDRFIFIDLKNEKDVMWATEESLKCGAVTGVIGELPDLSFIGSRRLQLAVEQSQVTGFILRGQPKKVNTTACVSRWRITSLPSEPIDNMPGIGFPQWRVELLKIRNGKPGVWDIRWMNGKFHAVENPRAITEKQLRKTG
jgi:protein ImuA